MKPLVTEQESSVNSATSEPEKGNEDVLSSETTVVVAGANGQQGYPLAVRLLDLGIPLRALVTNPNKPTAKRLAMAGANIRVGTLDDAEYVGAAVEGSAAVFSVPLAAHGGGGRALIENNSIIVKAAEAAGVETFVQTTVASLPNHLAYDGPMDWGDYGQSRIRIEAAVRDSSIANWTILQPAFFMDNFLPYRAERMYPFLYSQRRLDWPAGEQTPFTLIAAEDIGAYALAAMNDPGRFRMRSIGLGGDQLTLAEIAATISEVTGIAIASQQVSPADAVAQGYSDVYVALHIWMAERGYQTPPRAMLAEQWGVRPMTFRDWVIAHRDTMTLGMHP